MSKHTLNNVGKLLAAGSLALAGQSAFAASTETPSGTDITNTATVSYSVGAVSQPDETATRIIEVDNKVLFTVANTSGANVVPNAADQVLTFTITNSGNTTQGYALDVEASAGDNFDGNNVRLYVENGATAGFQAGEDTVYTAGGGANAGDLNPFGGAGADVMTVYVVADVPPNGGGTAPADSETADYHLSATTLNAGTTTVTTQTAGADTFNAIDVVFGDIAGTATGDGARDGVHSATGTYTVASSQLTVTKTSAVISDPFNGVSANAKSIPGAVVEYTITVANAPGASASASSVTLSDPIPANVTYSAGTITFDGAARTDAGDADNSDFGVTTGSAVTVDLGTVAAGTTHTITFRVTVD